MRQSQAVQEEGANRGHVPAPNIQVGSEVWLDAHNIRTFVPLESWIGNVWDLFGCENKCPLMLMN